MTHNVVDLYAGAGGMSLGFAQAGHRIVAAVERDEWAAKTYQANFSGAEVSVTEVGALPESFFRRHKGVEVVIGGPPCQGFSICASNRRNPSDIRNTEIFKFVDATRRLKPKWIVLENVPEIARFRLSSGVKLIDVVSDVLRENGYRSHWYFVNAADYGVPQVRKRCLLIASANRVPDLESTRTHGDENLGSRQCHPWLSVSDAISDLPPVVPGAVEEDEYVRYRISSQTDYQSALRALEQGVYNHVPMRHTARLVERFKAIEVGQNEFAAWEKHAPRKRGGAIGEVGTRFSQNHRRLNPGLPSPTITAFFYSTFLHPQQHRNLTVREAARIQSFPDDFRFYGKRTTLSAKLLEKKGLHEDLKLNQFNQVGNAVPPLLARAIAHALDECLEKVEA